MNLFGSAGAMSDQRTLILPKNFRFSITCITQGRRIIAPTIKINVSTDWDSDVTMSPGRIDHYEYCKYFLLQLFYIISERT